MVSLSNHKRTILMIIIGALMCIGGGSSIFFVWHDNHHTASLLPQSITDQITNFRPYFYTGQIPQGYSFDSSKITFSGQILMITLASSNPDSPQVVLTEQAMPPQLTDDDIQQNGVAVNFASGKATINDIEGRQVGTLIPNDRKTLILLTTQSQTSKDELTALLQQLQPLPR